MNETELNKLFAQIRSLDPPNQRSVQHFIYKIIDEKQSLDQFTKKK